jgi:hypothetical protein
MQPDWLLITCFPADASHNPFGRRCLAALLPALMSLRFTLAGLGVTREPRLVAGTAVSASAGCTAAAGQSTSVTLGAHRAALADALCSLAQNMMSRALS